MASATINQRKYLWSFEVRFGAGKPIDWFKAEIDKGHASTIIALCKEWEKTQEDNLCKNQIKIRLKKYNPDFQFKGDEKDAPAEIPPAVEEPNPWEKIKLEDSWKLPEILEALKPAVDNLEHLERLFKDRPIPEIPDVVPAPGYIKPPIYDEVYLCLKIKKNVLVYGPAGCGKSRMAKELADSLGLEYFPMSVGGGMRYKQVFGGDKIADGKSWFEPSDLLKAVQKPSLVLLDEIFHLEPDVLGGLNSLLEPGTREIQCGETLIKCHPECRFIACANTNGRTTDRTHTAAIRADGALLDRFVKTRMTYSDEVEKGLLEKAATAEIRLGLRTMLIALRKKLQAANIAFDPSTRRLIQAIDLCNAGMSVSRSFEMCFLEDLSPTERAKVGFKQDDETPNISTN